MVRYRNDVCYVHVVELGSTRGGTEPRMRLISRSNPAVQLCVSLPSFRNGPRRRRNIIYWFSSGNEHVIFSFLRNPRGGRDAGFSEGRQEHVHEPDDPHGTQ